MSKSAGPHMSNSKIIGTNKHVEIVLNGKYISEQHAILIEEDGRIFIEDLGSTFGTHVNGGQIKGRVELKPKDRVKLGPLLFHWQDYLNDSDRDRQTNPVFIKDLFSPFGTISWQEYKIILLLALGAVIVIPFGVPAVLTYLLHRFTRRNQELREEIDIWQYNEPLTILLGIICLYVFLNLSQKAIRGLKMKTNSDS